MLMDLVCCNHSKQLCNPGKQQILIKRFFVPSPALCKTETVFKVIDGFFNIDTDLICGIPILPYPGGYRDMRGNPFSDKCRSSFHSKNRCRDARSDRHAVCFCLLCCIPISFWSIQTSWSEARSVDGICFLPSALEATDHEGTKGCQRH